jgi:DnaJ-class molecular chaperone
VTRPGEQAELFTDPAKPCQACGGTGTRTSGYIDGFAYSNTRCLSCAGTGREADRPDPHRDPLPEQF